jgi:hypothetical protein
MKRTLTDNVHRGNSENNAIKSLDGNAERVLISGQQGRDGMPIEEMTNTDLLAAQRELMAKAKVARAAGDLDMAQRYLTFIRPMNHEMARRMEAM